MPTNRKRPCILAVSCGSVCSFCPGVVCAVLSSFHFNQRRCVFAFPFSFLPPPHPPLPTHRRSGSLNSLHKIYAGTIRPILIFVFSPGLLSLPLRRLCFLEGPRVGLSSRPYSGWCSVTMALGVFQRASCVRTPVIQPSCYPCTLN